MTRLELVCRSISTNDLMTPSLPVYLIFASRHFSGLVYLTKLQVTPQARLTPARVHVPLPTWGSKRRRPRRVLYIYTHAATIHITTPY